MRQMLPGAVEMVYDNYNFLAIGFGPTDRPSEAIFSIALAPRYVILCFLHGAKLKDPGKILRGGGNQVRNIIIRKASDLDRPDVRALINQAIRNAGDPIDPEAKRKLIIKSISAKQRPRRPVEKARVDGCGSSQWRPRPCKLRV
jgi:hypothetical protein